MQKIFHDTVEMFGYLSGETDFGQAFTRAQANIPGFAAAFDASVMSPLAEVAQDLNMCGFLLIEGLSDRVDTPGLSREQIREQEFAASAARASSASGGIFALLNDLLGGGLGDDFGSVPNIAVTAPGLGACQLVESGPQLSEVQRQRNRRIGMRLTKFVP